MRYSHRSYFNLPKRGRITYYIVSASKQYTIKAAVEVAGCTVGL